MSDSVSSFDVEAQQSLLEEIVAEDQIAAQDLQEADAAGTRKSKNWMRLFLLLRSVQVFKLASAQQGYSPVGSPVATDEITLTEIQESVIAAAVEISAESGEDTVVAEVQNQFNIELQSLSQRRNITEIVKNKNLQELVNFGGVRGVAVALNSDLDIGIRISSLTTEASQCSDTNRVLILMIIVTRCFFGACKNYTVLLLAVAAVLSLAFGIDEKGEDTGWFDGATVLFTIFLLIIGTTILDSYKELKFGKSFGDFIRNSMNVRVVRGGVNAVIPAYELKVGDIAFLQKGDQVPCDGIFVPAGDQSLQLEGSTTINAENPFLFYPSRVINGSCRMIVTSVGKDTTWGEMMFKSMESPDRESEFEFYLQKLNTCIHLTGLLISILIVVVLFLRYKQGKLDDENGFRPDIKGEPSQVKTITDAIKGIVMGSSGRARVLIALLSVSLVGIMEGMPFVISLAVAIWNAKTLLAHKASARDYLAFVKMASVTTICTDKFGGLTEHVNEVSKLYIGEDFVSESTTISPDVLDRLCAGIGTLRLVPLHDYESKVVPLVSWAEAKLGMNTESLSQEFKILSCEGCNPFQERCQVLLEKNGTTKYLHFKGPPMDILTLCSAYYDANGEVHQIDEQRKSMLETAIGWMKAECEAEVVAYACKDIDTTDEASSVATDRLIFLGMISLINAKREDAKSAVSTLTGGGIRTILVSGDDIEVLETICRSCGLVADDLDNLVLTAEEFRTWNDEEKRTNVQKISAVGNCLPSDKVLLVKCLRERGDVVALLGQCTSDAPALKQANIGLTFGTWSSEVARKSAHINIWDSDFRFLVNVIENGRSFQENVRKFIQLQLITTAASSCINFASTVFLGDAAMTPIQLFWLNLVMTVFGGLALLLGPATEELMNMPPVRSSLSLIITKAMWRNIVIQVSYQTTVFVTLQQKRQVLFGKHRDQLQSMVYNGFFFCQIINKFIAWRPKGTNIFRGMFNKSWWFLGATVVIIICQGMFELAEILIGSSPGLNWRLWCLCLAIGLFCLLVDCLGKMITSSFLGD